MVFLDDVDDCPEGVEWYEWFGNLPVEVRYYVLARQGTVAEWDCGGPDTPTVTTMTGMVASMDLTDRELRLILILKSVRDDRLSNDAEYMAGIVPWEESKEGMRVLLDHVDRFLSKERDAALQERAAWHAETFGDPAPDPALHEDYNPDNCSVYFVSAGGLIKIGFSKNHERRIGELGRSGPLPLTTLGIIPGGRNKEKALHDRFAEHRKHGEWFTEHEDILSYIYDEDAR